MTKKHGPLHILCVCGQKMRVTKAMAGAPARCVACRQRFRVPSAEVLEAQSPIDLAAEPQWLRATVLLPPREGEQPLEADEASPVDAPAVETRMAAVPLATSKPLQILASLHDRLARRKKLTPGDPMLEGLTPDEAAAKRAAVRTARERLDERLRRRLLKATNALAETQAAVERFRLVRRGSESIERLHKRLEDFRGRRDALEAQRMTLRGWLSVRTPQEAGGYVRLPLSYALSELPELEMPPPEAPADRFEEALQKLEAAMTDEGLYARARQAHWRAVLNRMAREWTEDAHVLGGMAKDLTENPSSPDTTDDDLRWSESAVQLAQELRSRAELAKQAAGAAMLPLPGRAAAPPMDGRAASRPAGNRSLAVLLRGMMGAAAFLLLAGLFFPVFGRASVVGLLPESAPGQPHVLIWLAASVVGIMLCLGQAVGMHRPRPGIAAALIILAATAGAISLHEAQYATGVLGSTARSGYGPSPGALLSAAGALLALGALAARWTLRRKHMAALLAVVLPFGAACVVLTDGLGRWGPHCELTATAVSAPTQDEPAGFVSVELRNTGPRVLQLDAAQGHPALPRLELRPQGKVPSKPRTPASYSVPSMRPGQSAEAAFESLEPGAYDVWLGGRSVQSIEVPPPVAAPTHGDPSPEEQAGGSAILDAASFPAPAFQQPALTPALDAVPPSEHAAGLEGLEAELRSRIATDAAEPVFSIVLRNPEGGETIVDVGLGDTVAGDWYVSEHSFTQETVTLYNDHDVAILRMGIPKVLPAPEELASSGEGGVSQRNAEEPSRE